MKNFGLVILEIQASQYQIPNILPDFDINKICLRLCYNSIYYEFCEKFFASFEILSVPEHSVYYTSWLFYVTYLGWLASNWSVVSERNVQHLQRHLWKNSFAISSASLAHFQLHHWPQGWHWLDCQLLKSIASVEVFFASRPFCKSMSVEKKLRFL